MFNTIAQIIGWVAVFSYFFIFIVKSRKLLLGLKCTNEMTWCVHMLMLGAMDGALMNACGALRDLCFNVFRKKKFAPVMPVVAFMAYGVVLGVTWFVWGKWLGVASLFLGGAVLVDSIVLYQSDPIVIKWGTIPTQLLWGIYCAMTHSIPGIVGNVLGFISVVISLSTYYYKKKKGTVDDLAV